MSVRDLLIGGIAALGLGAWYYGWDKVQFWLSEAELQAKLHRAPLYDIERDCSSKSGLWTDFKPTEDDIADCLLEEADANKEVQELWRISTDQVKLRCIAANDVNEKVPEKYCVLAICMRMEQPAASAPR